MANLVEELGLDRQVLDGLGMMVVISDLSATIVMMNRVAEETLGKKEAEVVGQNWFDAFAPKEVAEEQREAQVRLLSEGFDPSKKYPGELVTASGEVRVVEWQVTMLKKDDEVVALMGVAEDVTERRQLETANERSRQMLEAVAVVAEQFFRSGYSYWKEAVEGFVGLFGSTVKVDRVRLYKKDGNQGSDTLFLAYEWVAGEESARLGNEEYAHISLTQAGCERWKDFFLRSKSVHEIVRDLPEQEKEIILLDGVVSFIAVPVYVGSEWWGIMTLELEEEERVWSRSEIDAMKTAAITFGAAIQRKRVDEEMNKFAVGLERSNDVVFMTDMSGLFRYVNQAFVHVYGYTMEDLQGQTPRVLKSGVQTQEFYDQFWQTLLDGRVIAAEFINKTKSGSLVSVEASANPILNQEGEMIGFLAIQRDVTEKKRVADQLKRSEARYRDLFENANDLIQILDGDERFLYVNKKWLEMMKCRAEDIDDLRLERVVRKDKLDEYRRIRNGLSAEEVTGNFETVFVAKNGVEIIVEGNISKSSNVDGEERTRGIFRDVTEKRKAEQALKAEKRSVERRVQERTKELREKTEALEEAKEKIGQGWLLIQEEKARLLASINSLQLGFLMTDAENNVLYANNAVGAILGEVANWTMKELAQRLTDEVNLEDMCRDCARELKEQEKGSIAVGDKFIRLFVAPIVMNEKPGELIGMVILIEDMTEALLLQKTRDEFFAVASHELRTPLTAIRGNTSLIKQHYADRLQGGDFEEMIDDIHTASVRLIAIVNDFLDASKLELNKMDIKPVRVDMVVLVKRVMHDLEGEVKVKDLGWELDKQDEGEIFGYVDERRTEQIVTNYLGNALKLTESGEVRVWVEQDDGLVRIKVTDTGPGIKESHRKLLFRKFKQVGSQDYSRDVSQGTGMGLYISRLIAEAMGGRAYLEWSELNKGSTFCVELPRAT